MALALTALAGCTDDSFVGDENLKEANGSVAIGFNMSTPAVTRATGSAAATLLNNNFVVYGYKTVNSTPQVVFDNYQVNYADASGSSAGSTESNSAGWEYVSYKNLPGGVGDNTGVVAFSATTSGTPSNSSGIDQSIKYWDFSASAYDFFAYSLGAGSSLTWATASAMSNSTYSLTGTQAQLGTCYISKKKHIGTLSTSATEVDLEFVSFLSKIQLKFYENIPGYSVKDVKFYIDGSTKSTGDAANDGLKPAIYAASSIPTGGTYTITFDDDNNPVVTLSGDASSSASNVQFDAVTPASGDDPNVWLSGYAGKDYQEEDATVYLGRTSNTATSTKQMSVIPNSSGTALTLKMDYTLLSRDGNGETIQVTGATATVPAAYTAWKPNYAYTYIFKISDNTDGSTGGGTTGLYPVTLDAIVTDVEDGTQTTITTVAPTSITTYQNGAITNEYSAGNIYVVVGDGTTVLTAGTNANLYKATIEAGAAEGLDGSGNVSITEEMVANALTKTANGSGNYVLTDANGKNLTVTPVASGAADKLVGGLTSIPANDAPGGKALTINCANFVAANNTVYVFEYIITAVGIPYVEATGTYVSGTKYYTDNTGATEVDVTSFVEGTTDVSAYYVANSSYTPGGKHYKVIKVGTPTAQ